jgi:uncharacterized protein (TIGR00251 family)
MLIPVTATPTGVRFAVRVQPRASRNEIKGAHGSSLKVRLSAPPVDGAANEALADFLAEELGVARRAVTIVSGHTSRSKIIEVDGVTPQTIHRIAGQRLKKT